MNIQQVISTCPAPVSTAEGVSTAITWFNVARVFADVAKESDVPNKIDISARAQSYADNTDVGSTDYTRLNNRLYHIKQMYQGVVTVVIGS